MTNKEAIETLTSNVVENPELMYEALDMAIKALVKIEEIQEIINIDNSVIQEDVMKYKMVCEVIANDE